MKFSKYFNLSLQQPELDFVDIDTNRDLPLFIDPYVFSKRDDLWSVRCHNQIVSFFQTAIDDIREGRNENAKAILNNLNEPDDTFLGMSKGIPNGKGVSGKQALDIYKKLSESKAVLTGVLNELSDCELLIDGIGPDKISDITTNIIRSLLIEYTREQCFLHGIELKGKIASGRLWDADSKTWTQEYVGLPIVDGKRVILVPKASVRWRIALDHEEYYQHFVLNFLKEEHLNAGSSLVQVLKSGERRVTKKDLKEITPLSKDFLYRFSKDHPEVLELYKNSKGINGPLSNIEFESVDEAALARSILERLNSIKPGRDMAYDFHKLMIGALECIFYPDLIYPKKEHGIHDGRKRIDITYTNNANKGFFFRQRTNARIASTQIMVECKNYSSDPENEELDQLSGRFNSTRGWLGILVARNFDRDRLLSRCRDTARDGRGFIIPLQDNDIEEMLNYISHRQRERIDAYIERLFMHLLT